MKKWEKKYIGAIAVIFVISCVIAVVAITNKDRMSMNMLETIKTVAVVGLMLVPLAMLVYYAICGIRLMKNGIHNIKKFDDEIFKEIDKHKKCWGESKQNYIKQIQIINLVYGENGEVDKLVKNKEIDRLFARADYLSIQNSLFDFLMTSFSSLVISVIASFVIQMMECENTLFMFGWMIVIIVSFFLIVLTRYAERGQAGSYKYLVDEYERKLLFQKIECLEENIKCSAEDRESIETKRIIIEALIELIKKRKLSKQKEKVEKDIKTVEKLELCLENYDNCYKQIIYVNEKPCYLLYDKERGGENNYIGEQNLITQDFSILYEIIKKYDLIQYKKG